MATSFSSPSLLHNRTSRLSIGRISPASISRSNQNAHLSSSFVVRSTHSCFFNGGESYDAMVATYSSDPSTAVGGAYATRMNVFDRVSRIVKSYVNAALTAAEDPEKLLDQTVEEMTEDLIKLRQSTAQIIASRNILSNKYKQSQSNSDAWYKRAKLALEKGDEGLAKEALKRKKDEEEAANSLKSQLEQQEGIVEKLVSNTKLLESKIQEAKSKKDALKARAQSAKTSTKVNELLGNLNTSSALAAFDKMEEKVMALEAQSEAMNQLTADELSSKFALLESGDVDDDLAKLKQDVLGSSRRPGELPPGRSDVERSLKDLDLEAELNELRRRRD